MQEIMMIMSLICFIGIFKNKFTTVTFIVSLVIVIMTLLMLIQGIKFSNGSIVAAVVGILALAYSICIIFLHIDVNTLIVEPFLKELDDIMRF